MERRTDRSWSRAVTGSISPLAEAPLAAGRDLGGPDCTRRQMRSLTRVVARPSSACDGHAARRQQGSAIALRSCQLVADRPRASSVSRCSDGAALARAVGRPLLGRLELSPRPPRPASHCLRYLGGDLAVATRDLVDVSRAGRSIEAPTWKRKSRSRRAGPSEALDHRRRVRRSSAVLSARHLDLSALERP